MRISGPNANGAVGSPALARRSAAATFTVGGGESARGTGTTTALRNVGGIEALIALQGLEEAGERRKRAVKRGRVALDALDDLKIALLGGGSLSRATLNRLRSVAGLLTAGSGDDGLDAVLGEIELRVEVEIAKLGAR
jgi:hypothetical protein